MSETRFDGQQELKEKPKRLVIEIGASPETSYLNQYKVDLPPDTVYQIVRVDYAILPNEEDNRRAIPLDDSTVDEAVISNVLSDGFYSPDSEGHPEAKMRLRAFWKFLEQKGPISQMSLNDIQDEVAVFQKHRTVKDIIRVLKPKGILRIYDNYNPVRPGAVEKVLKLLEGNPEITFNEDIEEEERIKPLLDAENLEQLERKKKVYGKLFDPKTYYPRRTNNKVYKIVKK